MAPTNQTDPRAISPNCRFRAGMLPGQKLSDRVTTIAIDGTTENRNIFAASDKGLIIRIGFVSLSNTIACCCSTLSSQNDRRNRAATKECPFRIRLTSPLRFTALFCTFSVILERERQCNVAKSEVDQRTR